MSKLCCFVSCFSDLSHSNQFVQGLALCSLGKYVFSNTFVLSVVQFMSFENLFVLVHLFSCTMWSISNKSFYLFVTSVMYSCHPFCYIAFALRK